MDDNAVSPTLVDSCLNTWSSEEARLLAASLRALSEGKDVEKLEDAESPSLEEEEDRGGAPRIRPGDEQPYPNVT